MDHHQKEINAQSFAESRPKHNGVAKRFQKTSNITAPRIERRRHFSELTIREHSSAR